MIIILASEQDRCATMLASRWAPVHVGILTARDLSIAGWRRCTGCRDGSVAVVAGKPVAEENITGVLTRLPCVSELELVDIVAEDRLYAAAEMTAFLLFWLSQLRCSVLNRPTSTCLSGPYWRQEQWAYHAGRAGIPVQTLVRRVVQPAHCPMEQPGDRVWTASVTVVGTCWFGDVDPALARQALWLADLAGTELLTVRFSDPERGAHFVDADIFPDLSDQCVADAVLKRLQGDL